MSPSAEYKIPAPEIEKRESLARSGDCKAAYDLARHHSYYSLQRAESIRWLRIAARCPTVNPKLELIAILSGDESPENLAELEQLIAAVRLLDPAEAERVNKAIQRSGNEGNADKPARAPESGPTM